MSSSPQLTFRKATPADAPAVLALVRSAYRGESSRKGWTTEADFLADERIDEAGVLAKINEANGAVLLAFTTPSSSTTTTTATVESEKQQQQQQQQQQTPLLLACCEVLGYPGDGGLAYFGLFAVNPTLQNGGIGRRLLGEAERYAMEVLGARQLEMQVVWLRDELIAWYVRRGYKLLEGERRPFPYEQLVNGKALRDDLYFVILRKDLA